MKILIISKLMPSTTGVSGAAIVYNRIRHIVSLGWDVDVLTFIPSGDGVQEEAARLREYVRRLEMLPLPTEGSLGYRQLYSFPRVPYPFCTVSSLAMALLTGEMVRRERYNVALAEFSEMGQYLFANPYLGAVRRIVSCHECRTAAWERAIRLHLWRYGGITKRLHFKRLRRYEFAMYNNMDHVLALTSQERHALLNTRLICEWRSRHRASSPRRRRSAHCHRAAVCCLSDVTLTKRIAMLCVGLPALSGRC